MTTPISESVMFRLYLARHALEAGRRLVMDALPYPRMQALMALDDAAEWTILTLLSVLEVRPKRDAALSEYLAPLVAEKRALGSYSGPLEALRRLRDRVKHDGVVPSPEDARQAAVQVESFVRAAIAEVLGRALEEISPVELVGEKTVKQHLRMAETNLAADKYDEATDEAALAFAFGTRALLGGLALGDNEPQRAARDLVRRINTVAPGADRFETMVELVVGALVRPTAYLRLGISLDDVERFQVLTRRVTVYTNRMELGPREYGPPRTRDEAIFAVDFATTAILRIEEWERRRRR